MYLRSNQWPEERTELLKSLIAESKLSASQIAAKLGVTRNAVIGKSHRLGLYTAQVTVRLPRRAPKRYTPMAKTKQQAESLIPPQETPVLAPSNSLKSLFDLSATIIGGDCRWPMGVPQDADFGFCGREAQPDSVYCRYHHMMAYTGVTRRVV